MPSFSIPFLDNIKRIFKRDKNKPFKFIFTKKGWIIFGVVLVSLSLVVGFLTWLVKYSKIKAFEETVAYEAALYGEEVSTLFEQGRLLVPKSHKGVRESKTTLFREKREKWSSDQIVGTKGDGFWSDPAEISSEIFANKNDIIIDELFSQVKQTVLGVFLKSIRFLTIFLLLLLPFSLFSQGVDFSKKADYSIDFYKRKSFQISLDGTGWLFKEVECSFYAPLNEKIDSATPILIGKQENESKSFFTFRFKGVGHYYFKFFYQNFEPTVESETTQTQSETKHKNGEEKIIHLYLYNSKTGVWDKS